MSENWIEKWLSTAVEMVACEVSKHSPLAAYVSENGVASCGRMRPEEFRIGETGYPLTLGEYRSKALGVVKPHDKLEPLAGDDSLRRLLANPNPTNNIHGLLFDTQTCLGKYGKSFIWKVRNNKNIVCELVSIHPDRVVDKLDCYEIFVGKEKRTVPYGDIIAETKKVIDVTNLSAASEEEAKEFVMASTNIPKGMLGTSDRTYGSILAIYSAFSQFCINPILATRGAIWTKELASEFSTPGKRAVIWWDDVSPMDEDTIQSDIRVAFENGTMTTSAVRRLRGRA